MKNCDPNRRQFVKTSAALGAALSMAPAMISCSKEKIARGSGDIVLARDAESTTGLDEIHTELVQKLVDKGIRAFTGLSDVGKAWKSIFPSIDNTTVIGLKVNCVAGNRPKQLCTQIATVDAIINGLVQMPVDGRSFPQKNILVWDRWGEEMEGAGYKLNQDAKGVKITGISKNMEDTEPIYGYDEKAMFTSLDDKAYFTTILSKVCDYQINIPVLKSIGHGVTFALKNSYGNFSSAFPHWADIGSVFHKEFPSRICDINGAPLMQERFVLHVGDAILGKKTRGPAGPADFSYGAILFSKDPVALDAVGVEIIREQEPKIEMGQFITMAEERGLGIANLEKIKIQRV